MKSCSAFGFPAAFGLACLLASPNLLAAEVRASGRVLDLNGSPVAGVVVQISGSDEVATTDASGDWILGTGTNMLPRKASAASLPLGNLRLEQGRIRVGFQGFDPQGRGVANSFPAPGQVALRQALADTSKDTLVFSNNGKVFLRDTLTPPRTGIVRIYDTTWNAKIIYGWLEDSRDLKVYRSVKIGGKIWMAENLGFAGKSPELGVCYGSEDSCKRYGRLYKWTEMMSLGLAYDTTLWNGAATAHVGICPGGWHIPTKSEWTDLQVAVDPDNSYDGNRLKSPFFWQGSSHGEDKHGFRALPGGRFTGGNLEDGGVFGYWWSRTENFRTSAEFFEMYSHNDNTMLDNINKLTKQSVRCVLD